MAEPKPIGINYHTKSRWDVNPYHLFYPPNEVSLTDDQIRQEMKVIKDELHCDAVRIVGHTNEELIRVGKIARERGLTPWYSPRFVNATRAETESNLADFCKTAVTAGLSSSSLIVANELPYDCADNLGTDIKDYKGRGEHFVNEFLRKGRRKDNTEEVEKLVQIARREGWKGAVTYASLPPKNETINWDRIEDDNLVVSCNLYWGKNWPLGRAWSDKEYRAVIQELKRKAGERHVIISEFGTVPQHDALKSGGGAYKLDGSLNYDAQAQAYKRYLTLLQQEGVGYFAYAFSEPKPGRPHQDMGLLLRDANGTATRHTPAADVFASFNSNAKAVHGVSINS